ncbi:MAG: hypothetical protein AB1724_01020 [Thermodesulfobacteriota bacterium]
MKSAWTRISIVMLTVVIIIAGGELVVRHKLPGYATPPPHPPCRHDDVLGWRNQATAGELPSLSSHRQTVMVSHTADGRRITSPDKGNMDDRGQVVVIGDSLTYGYGLSDEETWPWLLQQRTPCTRVLNYGTPGYGTYQCLLTLERILPELSSPRIVLYGFLEHHLVRNVAPPSWRAVLNMNRGQEARLPYVSIDQEDRLIRHPAASVRPWPFSRSLALVRFSQVMVLSTLQGREYFKAMDMAWQRLMTEMRDLCAARGARLVVVVLGIDHRQEKFFYTTFFERNGIPFIDADMDMAPDMFLEKDPSHPNHRANAAWADIISRHVFCDPKTAQVVFD